MEEKKYRFALDIGTNSIGWAVVRLNEEGTTLNEAHCADNLAAAGVRVFSDGRDGEDPKNAVRQTAKQIRRQRARRCQRKEYILSLNEKFGLYQSYEDRLKELQTNPYYLRAKALKEQLTPSELARVFYHLSLRRGYKSNRKEGNNKKEGEDKAQEKIQKLSENITQINARTLGEYFWKKHSENPHEPIRFVNGFAGDILPNRGNYEEEFDLIREKQEPFFPNVDWDVMKEAVFFHRPLKKQEIGCCRFEENERRAYKVMPSSQRVRIWQDLTNLRFQDQKDGSLISLSFEEKKNFFDLLNNKQKSLKISQLLEKLGSPTLEYLNTKSKEKLEGNALEQDLCKPEYFGKIWCDLSLQEQDDLIFLLIQYNSYEDEEDKDKVFQRLRDLDLNEEQIRNILDYKGLRNSDSGKTTSLSALAQRKLFELYEKEDLPYHEACAKLYGSHSIGYSGENYSSLPYYGVILEESCTGKKDPQNAGTVEEQYGRIANPTVHIALNQMRIVVNYLIHRFGKPHSVIVELARDLKRSKDDKARIQKEQKANEKLNTEAKKELESLGLPNSYILHYKLFKRQCKQEGSGIGCVCPYCGDSIKLDDLKVPNKLQIDHILPYKRFLNDGIMNKVLVHTTCNRNKGNRTPYEWFKQENRNYEEVLERIQHYPDAVKKNFSDLKEDDVEAFLERQLNDTRYLSRLALQYLKCLGCKDIIATTGGYTAKFRHLYGLNSLLDEKADRKTRTDHRHHAVDAVVIATLDRSRFQRLVKTARNKNTAQEFIEQENVFKIVACAAGLDKLPYDRQKLQEIIDGIITSVKPRHKHTARFFKETAYGKIKKAVPIFTHALKEEDVHRIVSPRIQNRLEELLEQTNGKWKKTIELLNEEESQIDIYEEFWVTTKPLTSLGEAEFNEQQAGNKHQGPVSDALRSYVREKLREGKTLSAILQQYTQETGVKRVRYIPKDQKIFDLGEHRKGKDNAGKLGYALDGYAYVNIWAIPDGKGEWKKYEGEFVSYWEANQNNFQGRRPHPHAKKLMRLYKDDVIRCEHKEEKTVEYYRITDYSATDNRISIISVNSAAKGQNLKSLNVIFEDYKVSKMSSYLPGR